MANEISHDIIFVDNFDEKPIKEIIEKIITINRDDDLKEKMKDFNRIDTPIKLYMTTPGGSCYLLLALFDIIENSKTPVWIYVSGFCCSAGFYLLGAADKRIAYPNTWLMYHQLSSAFNHDKLVTQTKQVEQLKKLQQTLDNLILNNTKISKEKLKEVNERAEDWYMDVTEAMELGVIDIIEEGRE